MSSSSFASRRNNARGRAAEGSENEAKVGADPPVAPLHSRSPLISIQDPSQGCSDHRLVHHPTKGGGATPKSGQTTPVRPTSRGFAGFGASIAGNSGHLAQYVGVRERAASARITRAMVEAKDLTPVVVPHYELSADSNFWEDHNVQVLVRIRPLNETEITLQGYKRCLAQESAQTVEWTGHPGARFTFDHVACETTSQENLFQIVGLPMVENCMSGYNSCMFAYGQTGSGKTYTMMGEIGKMDNMLSQDCGITPRIFEYLFTRIREEENARSCDKLRYNCKCSFLEIYNEQITDLLEPSSTNLQLREDIDNGVYVENLKEHKVSSVKDVMELLLQGAANRKMAATYMNSESSRSHSVFTCVIESRWEKDSMSHLRFGRLNLVDLAGSERQKSSGAEGERLKEAANINRSLSTLGLVIMTLVDIANGKNRHVPYRDSRLTFLLQDSLGGNSKTTIVANISPSICSMNETLSTLKFAQRAKLIQNNAKVNEGTSGDVISLQRQIQKLKDQLALVMNHQNVPKSLCPPFANPDNDNSGGFCLSESFSTRTNLEALSGSCLPDQKIKYLEDALSRALRREKMAEAEIRRLEAEIKHSNFLVQPKENGEKCLTEEHILGTQMLDRCDSTIRDIYLPADQIQGIGGTSTFSLLRRTDKYENLKEPKLFDNENEDEHRLQQCRVEMEEDQKQIFTDAAKTGTQFTNETSELLKMDEWRDSNFVENSLLRSKNEKLNDQLCMLTEENSRLQGIVVAKNAEICAVSDAWEKAVADLAQFLSVGCKSLEDASEYIESLKSTFPLGTLSINENVERAIKVSFEKEMVIADLQRRLEAAKHMSLELELKLDCLKGATLAITDAQQLGNERNIEELCSVNTSSCKNDTKIQELEILLNSKEAQRVEAERSADAAFSVIKKLYDMSAMEQLDMPDIKFMIREILQENSLEKNQSVAKNYQPAKSNNEIFNIDPTRWPKFKMIEHESSYPAVDIGHNQEPNIEDSSKLEGTIDIHDRSSSNHIASAELCRIIQDLEPNDVMRELEEKTNQADRLLLKFEEAQEAMEEAENILKMLLNVNEDLTIERDWWRKVCQEELAAKILLMEELHRLEASKSSAQMQYQLFQDQIAETIEDMSDQILSLKISFQHMEKIIAEVNPFLANALTFGKELLGCINTSRSFLKDPETIGKDHKLFTLYQYRVEAFLNQMKNLSLTSLQMEPFSHFTTSPTHCTHMNILKNNEIFEVQNMLLKSYQRIHSFENSKEVLNVSEEVDATAATLKYSKLNDRREKEATSDQLFLEKNTVLEKENLDLKHDMNLAHEMIINLAADCFNFIKGMNLNGTAQAHANIHIAKGNTEIDHVEWQTWHKHIGDSSHKFEDINLLHDILQENEEDCLNGEDSNCNERVRATTTDVEVLYNEIQQLKHKCLVSLQFSKEHEDHILCQKNKVKEVLDNEQKIIPLYDDENKMTSYTIHAKSEFGNLLIQRINELVSKFHNLSSFSESGLQSNNQNLKDQSLHKSLLESVSIIEAKVHSILKQWPRNVIHAHELTDDFSSKKELARKDGIIEGLLFDLRLLQESTSSFQDMKVKMEETCAALNKVQEELERKNFQLADALSNHKVLEQELAKSEVMLSTAIPEMEHAKNVYLMLSEENSELRVLLEGEQVKNNHMEEQLEEKNMVIDSLEKEIISVRSSGANLFSSFEDILDEMEKVSNEKDNLQKEMCNLNDRLEMVITLADEKEAIAVEARQVAEENKAYAQEKEEEIKILEHSIEELEATIDVLERKVSDMKDEVQSHHLIRKQLELEVKYMIGRLYKAENDVEKLTTDISCPERECLLRRRMDDSIIEHFEAREEIKKLEMEIIQKNEETKQYEKYISELVLHSEAQSSLYQDKFKALSEMILDVKNDASVLDSSGSNVSKVEKNSARTRGSRSPFRCISSLVQQMNLEKEHELSLARHRIEELEALATSRQKEVCELTARLAAVDSMTHDVIRDLLGVKLDLTKYANLIDQEDLQKLVTRAHEIKDETNAKDMEILDMKESINKLMDERKSLLEEIDKKRTDMLAQQVLIEQLRQRDQLMTAKNEILKMDKSDLQRRIVALDERATKLSIGSSNVRGVQTTCRRLHEH